MPRGEVWGPLHGVPMTVKESFNVVGLPSTWGNPPWRDNIAADNAVLIERLLAAGAVIYGKTNVPFMLQDAQSYNEVYGTTNNPWDKARGPGGSSGGEGAALAAGLSALGARRRQRHRRLVAQPGALLRHLRSQAELGVDPDPRSFPDRRADPDRHLGGRPDGARCRGSRSRAARPRRSRSAATGGVAGRIAGAAPPPARRFPRRGLDEIAALPDRCKRRRAFRRGRGSAEPRRRHGRRSRPPAARRCGAPEAVHAAAARRDRVAHERRGFRRPAGDRRHPEPRRHELACRGGARRDGEPPRLGRRQ
jgi:hypothetical protein